MTLGTRISHVAYKGFTPNSVTFQKSGLSFIVLGGDQPLVRRVGTED